MIIVRNLTAEERETFAEYAKTMFEFSEALNSTSLAFDALGDTVQLLADGQDCELNIITAQLEILNHLVRTGFSDIVSVFVALDEAHRLIDRIVFKEKRG